MSKNRIRIHMQPITREQAENLVGEIATLTLESNSQKIEMDRKITAIREPYEATIARLQGEIDLRSEKLASWAANNPDEFPKNRRSIDMVQGTIGFRLGTPKLLALARKKWDAILETIRGMDLPAYIRTKEDVNKEAILNDYGQKLVDDDTLRKIGVQVVQEEGFYVEPKLQDLANRQTTEAA